MTIDLKEAIIQSVVEEDDILQSEAEEALESITITPGQEFPMLDGQWLVLDEDEALERATEDIKRSVGYFDINFIGRYTEASEELLGFLARYEKHELVEEILKLDSNFSWDRFIEDAVDEDGYGHFLNTYDGRTRELGSGFYLFRMG